MLQQLKVDHEIVLYLKTKPGAEELRGAIARLEDPVGDLVRRDKFYKENIANATGFDESSLDDAETVIEILVAHPRLLQRPVIVTDEVAIIGRPRDRVPALFE